MTDRLIIGIDGGGTKTAVSIAKLDEGDNIIPLGGSMGGPSNILSVGRDRAFDSLNTALDAACADAGISPGSIERAVMGMAGTSSDEVRRLLTQWTSSKLSASSTQLVSDIEPVMMAGTQENWGLAIIVGTGSIVKGINELGDTETLGGWGYWFGDHGGGYDLGRQALVASAKAVDGIGPQTELLDAICARLDISKPSELLVALGRDGDVRGKIASLAKLVPDLAEAGDAVATQLLTEAVSHIVALCESLNQRLKFSSPVPVGMAGGVMCHSEFYRNKFEQALRSSQVNAGQITLVEQPVDGCLKLARKMLLTP